MLTVDANVWVAAFDPRDRFHASSMTFLEALTERRIRPNGPAFLHVEVACALARRAQSPATGEAVLAQLNAHPTLIVQSLDEDLLRLAARLGTQHTLRGADALYAATARALGSPLVSWDEELVRRAGAITPGEWLAANE